MLTCKVGNETLLLTNETVMINVKSSVTRNDGPSGISSYAYIIKNSML